MNRASAVSRLVFRPRAAISGAELRAKTIWIRDELEPNIARHGPRFLAPDTVLELNSFFNLLTTHESIESSHRPTSITIVMLQESRIHRALLLITGRGTRWPRGLVEMCDALVREWTAMFGDLELIRPSLYGSGGRLQMFKEEKDMSRHELVMKWMSDPHGDVSPLRALEWGHLGFKPGQWWIHPMFAFHAGIIDSPDPHGGISADGEGSYAILLTDYDEVLAESADAFTYRCRNDDSGRTRLISQILPPKQGIRILRSHTLHSIWAPSFGVRYDGLHVVSKWSVRLIEEVMTFEVTFQREIDQVSMREARRHPTADEADDYLEYKRIRDGRQREEKSGRRLGTFQEQPSPQDEEAETEEEKKTGEETEDKPSNPTIHIRKRSDSPDVPSARIKLDPIPIHERQGLSPSRVPHDRHSAETSRLSLDAILIKPTTASEGYFDGFVEQMDPYEEESSLGSADPSSTTIHSASARFDEVVKAESPKQSADSAYHTCFSSRRSSTFSLLAYTNSRSELRRKTSSLDHNALDALAHGLTDLRAATLKKDAVGSAFLDDLNGMHGIVERWERESVGGDGHVDSCLISIKKDIEVMMDHRRRDGDGKWTRVREVSGTTETARLKEYEERYSERAKEGGDVAVEPATEEKISEENPDDFMIDGIRDTTSVRTTEGKWVLGDEFTLY